MLGDVYALPFFRQLHGVLLPGTMDPGNRLLQNHAEGLVRANNDVTLFATADLLTSGRLEAVCSHPYEEDPSINLKVWKAFHISNLMEQTDRFDLIHNHYDFLPLPFSRLINTPMVTTIHGFSSPSMLPVYKKYDGTVHYISISNADRKIDVQQFTYQERPGSYLLFLGRIQHDKGTREAIEIARAAELSLVIAGIIQDKEYYERYVP